MLVQSANTLVATNGPELHQTITATGGEEDEEDIISERGAVLEGLFTSGIPGCYLHASGEENGL